MEIIMRNENGVLTVALSGKLDTTTAPELEQRLKPALDGANALVFDFTNLEYISSAGLRILLASHKIMAGNMTILHANEMISDVFRMTGMSTVFNIG